MWTEHFLTSGLYFKAQDVAIELRFRYLSDEILHMVYHDDITKKYEYRHIIIVGIYQCTACAIIISVNDNKVRMEYLGHILSYQIYYRKISNIRRTLVGNKIVDHSDVVGASPVGAAPTTSSFST